MDYPNASLLLRQFLSPPIYIRNVGGGAAIMPSARYPDITAGFEVYLYGSVCSHRVINGME